MRHGAKHRMTVVRWLLPTLLLCAVAVLGSGSATAEELPRLQNQPHAGYAYPAGGQVGTTCEIKVGGMSIRNVTAVHVSGGDVEAEVLYWAPPPRPLNDRDQSRELIRQLVKRRDEILGVESEEWRRLVRQQERDARKAREKDGETETKKPAELPKHPMLNDIASKTLDELREIAEHFFVRRNPLQRKRSIEETVKLRLTIAADAVPGARTLRLQTRSGVSNPIQFRIGLHPEFKEREQVRSRVPIQIDRQGAVDLPVTLNGQIKARDEDRFRLRAKKGQRLVIRAEARALVPFQADSVPGWMQATLTLFDTRGLEVAFADDHHFDPDPVLYYEVPKDGEYTLLVRDAIARGRDDFVYRVTVSEDPYVTHMFPLGGREGVSTDVTLAGWNIDRERASLDTRAGGGLVRDTAFHRERGSTNRVTYAVDTLTEVLERESNDAAGVQALTLPVIVNGRIHEPGDVDTFSFEGRNGQEVVVEVTARQLGSPLDSVIYLVDASGDVVAWNDDYVPAGLETRGLGLQTHHADSYLEATLPRSGTYHVRLADVRRHGAADHAYRLRVSAPRPDVDLYLVPSNLSVAQGQASVVSVQAIRKDGYDGDIDFAIEEGEGFFLGGGRIPSGRDHIRMTLTAPAQGRGRTVQLRLSGTIDVGGESVKRPVVAADNVMQAFLWRHIVPADELVVTIVGAGRRGGRPPARMVESETLRIRAGESGKATVRTYLRQLPKGVTLALFDPPKGVTLGPPTPAEGGLAIEIRVAEDFEALPYADNLIVQVVTEREFKGRDGKKQKRKIPAGTLPAIPIEIVGR